MSSPLLANIYLNALDRAWEDRCGQLGVLAGTRMTSSCCAAPGHRPRRHRPTARAAPRTRAGAGRGQDAPGVRHNDCEGFDFLGFHHRMMDRFSRPGASVPGPLAIGARHASGAATNPRAHRSAAADAADRRRHRQPQTGSWPAGATTSAWQLDPTVRQIDRYAIDRVGRLLAERYGKRRRLVRGRRHPPTPSHRRSIGEFRLSRSTTNTVHAAPGRAPPARPAERTALVAPPSLSPAPPRRPSRAR
jgi:hypothetical protein